MKILVSLSPDILALVDRACGRRGRSAEIEARLRVSFDDPPEPEPKPKPPAPPRPRRSATVVVPAGRARVSAVAAPRGFDALTGDPVQRSRVYEKDAKK